MEQIKSISEIFDGMLEFMAWFDEHYKELEDRETATAMELRFADLLLELQSYTYDNVNVEIIPYDEFRVKPIIKTNV